MAYDDTVKAYLRVFTREELEGYLKTALTNLASGVTVTTVSFEGGNTTGQSNVETQTLISILNHCLDLLDRGWPDVRDPEAPHGAEHWDFSRVRLGT